MQKTLSLFKKVLSDRRGTLANLREMPPVGSFQHKVDPVLPAEDNEHILDAFLAMMSEGIERSISNGWIEKDATDERKIVSGIMYIVAHEMGNVSYRDE
ncbi:MAG: hypothetical protein ACOX8R_02460 [Bacillota bacterium]|jgi:hypothetical protein